MWERSQVVMAAVQLADYNRREESIHLARGMSFESDISGALFWIQFD